MSAWRTAIVCIPLLLSSGWTSRADVPPLQPRGYTNDFAGVMSADGVSRADRLAGEVERKAKAQIAVVIVQTLGGEPIENYANTLARRWGIGGKDDRGVLLLIAVQDRRNRLEVGYGLEPILPDGRAGSILRSLRPQLRQGDYDGAVLLAVSQLAEIIAEASGVTLEAERVPAAPQRPQPEPLQLPWWTLALGLIGLIGLIWFISKVGILPAMMMGGVPGWDRSSHHGGGWDGGGFSGFGGGDFGGGGASSDW